jgi:hypothetical protein
MVIAVDDCGGNLNAIVKISALAASVGLKGDVDPDRHDSSRHNWGDADNIRCTHFTSPLIHHEKAISNHARNSPKPFITISPKAPDPLIGNSPRDLFRFHLDFT